MAKANGKIWPGKGFESLSTGLDELWSILKGKVKNEEITNSRHRVP